MSGGGASPGHRDLTPSPRPPELDRTTRAVVLWAHLLESVQHVLGAQGSPQGEKLMI
jgi:hypothetical protein